MEENITKKELEELRIKAKKYDESQINLKVKPEDITLASQVDIDVEQTTPPPEKVKDMNECGECGAKFEGKPDVCPKCNEELEWEEGEE